MAGLGEKETIPHQDMATRSLGDATVRCRTPLGANFDLPVMQQMQTNPPFSRGFCHEGMAGGPSVSYMQNMTGSVNLIQEHGMMVYGKSGPVHYPTIPWAFVQESDFNNHAISNRERQVGFEEGRGRKVMKTEKSIQPIDSGKRKRVDCMERHNTHQDTHYTKSSNKSEQSRWTMRNPRGHARSSDSYLQQLFKTKGGYRVEGLGDTGDGEAKDSKPHPKQKIIKYLGQENFVKVQTTILRQVGTFKRQLHDLHRVVVVQREMVSTERGRRQNPPGSPSHGTQTKNRTQKLSCHPDPIGNWFASHYGFYPGLDGFFGSGAFVPWWQDASKVFGDPALAAAQVQEPCKEVVDKQATSHLTSQKHKKPCGLTYKDVHRFEGSRKEKLKSVLVEGSSDWSEESSVGSDLVTAEEDSRAMPHALEANDNKVGTIIPTAKPANPKSVAGILGALHR
eukprot:CAMPEP_0183829278 /NCGR_PEP_ID=MMETSP0807_2-20130328/3222_1 /TAXON_ID=88271 /ORGANISM="Picocystis salinarum, Strain CCMP1897" /LENGTH=450 /DNA_ID=CAMNT_0026074485 /DNA_START=265 /DNA_END=1617 /DNA_ORIENTATION=-